MTLFISSCENEKLEPTPTRQSISPSDFITRSQSAVENINEFYRQNSDNGLESRSDSLGFEERWGNPNYDQLLSLHTANGEELVIAPLQDLITGTVHNLMVGWQQEGSIPLRIVHDNRVLTDLTFNNTPITPTVPVLFELYNSGEDIAEAVRMYAGDISGCIETIPCPWSCLGCIYCAEECGPIGGTGGIPTNNGPHPTGGGGTANPSNNNQGETTDPDCTTEDPSNGPPSGEVFDNPDCVNTCAGTFDTNCDGMIDDTELCLQLGIGGYNCSLAAQNQALLDLLIENADTPENLALISAPGILVSTTCASSFDYVPVGNGFTAQVNDVGHSYFAGYFGVIGYKIPELCIQVSGSDANGVPLTATKAAQLSAYAMDNARYTVFDRIQEGLIVTNTGAKDDFRNIYRDELIQLTGGQTTSSISYGPCLGSIPETAYKLAPLGFDALCIKMW